MSANRLEIDVEGGAEPGPEWIHFYRSMTVPIDFHRSETFDYGSEMRITSEMRDAGIDRSGRSWLDLLAQPDEQIKRFGELAYGPGRWPDGLPKSKPGSKEWLRERDKLRVMIQRTSDRYERAKLQAAYRDVYGSYLDKLSGASRHE